jgi:Ca2+/Na+ antiporter
MPAPKEQGHPFYKPLWRRVVITAVVLFWFVFELVNGGLGIWSLMAFAMLVYAVYMFFLTWPKDDAGPKS